MENNTYDDLETTIRYLQSHYGGSLEENQQSLKDLIHILSELAEAVGDAQMKFPSWNLHLQTLIAKIIFTSHSIVALSLGYDYGFYKRREKIRIIDYSSLFTLTRALIENYVTLCYIYNNELPEEEKIFRFKLWEVSGLISRQNFDTLNLENDKSITEEINKKKEAERLLIEKIMNDIRALPEYGKLDSRKLNQLSTYGLARVQSWQMLIQQCDLGTELFSTCYSFFSSYAHSEYLSILQISQANMNSKNPQNITNAQTSLGLVRMIIALSIEFYTKSFKPAEITYNTFPDKTKMAIKIWQDIARQKQV